MVASDESPTDDGRAVVGTPAMEPGELYVVVRRAVEDAILGVIGTLLLVGVALVVVWFGVMITVSAYDSNAVAALAGAFVALVGFYMAASALDVVPSVGDLV